MFAEKQGYCRDENLCPDFMKGCFPCAEDYLFPWYYCSGKALYKPVINKQKRFNKMSGKVLYISGVVDGLLNLSIDHPVTASPCSYSFLSSSLCTILEILIFSKAIKGYFREAQLDISQCSQCFISHGSEWMETCMLSKKLEDNVFFNLSQAW